MPIENIPRYHVISKQDLVDELKKRMDNMSMVELKAMVLDLANKVDAKELRDTITG